MRVVLDANLVAALIIPLVYSDQALRRLRDWQSAGVVLVAPTLLEYETVMVLCKAVVPGLMTTEEASEALEALLALKLITVAPTPALHERALRWSDRLGHKLAYDAQYVALAEHFGVEPWTADRRLANGARQARAPWVRWIGQEAYGPTPQP
jgi:predicted nucleic acid-binding protein